MTLRTEDAIYLRKSQLDKDLVEVSVQETLSRHKKILLEVAERQGLNVTKIYEEVVSGESIQSRIEIKELLRDVQLRKYRSVVVMELERLARGGTKDQGVMLEAFKYSETKIVTKDRTYDLNNESDEEMVEMGLFFSRKEYKTIQRRMLTGKVQSVKEGNYLGPVPPYGYDLLKLHKRHRTLSVNELEGKVVQQIFEWHTKERLSVGEITRRLTAMNVPTRTNKIEWNRGSVTGILKNVTYTGKVRWYKSKVEMDFDGDTFKKIYRDSDENHLIVDGKHPALIDEETFELAQSFFIKAPRTGSQKVKNPFAGVLVCKNCGFHLTLITRRSDLNCKPRITHPQNYHCKTKSVLYYKFYDKITAELKKMIEDFKIELNNFDVVNKTNEYEQTKLAIETNLKKQKHKLTQMFDDYEEGIYDRNEFKERKDLVNKKIENLRDELENLKPPTDTVYETKISSFSKLIETLDDPTIPAIHKNDFVKSIINKIEYTHNIKNVIELDIHFN